MTLLARCLLVRVLLFLACLGVSPVQANATYTLAVVPQFAPVDIGLRWTPLLERIKRDTGISLQLRIAGNIPAFEGEFLGGIPDFVYLNPYHMVMAAQARSYRPLVRGRQSLSGILVVRKDDKIQHIRELDGATLAFPAPNAFGASLFMRALLMEREGISFAPSYVGTHQNVYRHVLLGDARAGGGIESTLEREPEGIRRQLRILFRTPDTASHPLAVHPRVPMEVAERISEALVRLAQDPAGRQLLAEVELDGALPADYGRDYGPLERLRLERHVQTRRK
jgi:phosphonate transport system substrate-binding protein